MRTLLVAVLLLLAVPCKALPPECNLHQFPRFWADAQDRVGKLKALLNSKEEANPYSLKSRKQFESSLGLCEAKRKPIWDGTQADGSAGVSSQMKCEALLLCSRLTAIDMKF